MRISKIIPLLTPLIVLSVFAAPGHAMLGFKDFENIKRSSILSKKWFSSSFKEENEVTKSNSKHPSILPVTNRKLKISAVKKDLNILRSIDELPELKNCKYSLEHTGTKVIALHEWILDYQENKSLEFLVNKRPYFDDLMDISGLWNGINNWFSKSSINFNQQQKRALQNLESLVLEAQAVRNLRNDHSRE